MTWLEKDEFVWFYNPGCVKWCLFKRMDLIFKTGCFFGQIVNGIIKVCDSNIYCQAFLSIQSDVQYRIRKCVWHPFCPFRFVPNASVCDGVSASRSLRCPPHLSESKKKHQSQMVNACGSHYEAAGRGTCLLNTFVTRAIVRCLKMRTLSCIINTANIQYIGRYVDSAIRFWGIHNFIPVFCLSLIRKKRKDNTERPTILTRALYDPIKPYGLKGKEKGAETIMLKKLVA